MERHARGGVMITPPASYEADGAFVYSFRISRIAGKGNKTVDAAAAPTAVIMMIVRKPASACFDPDMLFLINKP